jgi:hypothetical protein
LFELGVGGAFGVGGEAAVGGERGGGGIGAAPVDADAVEEGGEVGEVGLLEGVVGF